LLNKIAKDKFTSRARNGQVMCSLDEAHNGVQKGLYVFKGADHVIGNLLGVVAAAIQGSVDITFLIWSSPNSDTLSTVSTIGQLPGRSANRNLATSRLS
jgi:hypothetical protein